MRVIAGVLALGIALIGAPAGAGPGEPEGAIAGTVTDTSGAPVQDVCIELWDAHSHDLLRWSATDERGAYRVSSIDDGEYAVSFNDCSDGEIYLSEWYDDKPTIEDADPVVVLGGAETAGIDAQLAVGGGISGTITDASGNPATDVCVEVLDLAGEPAGWGYSGESGAYRVGALPSGGYKINFRGCGWGDAFGSGGYLPEWYDDEPDFESADPVAVVVGSDTAGIDAVLDPALSQDLAVSDLVVEPVPLQTDQVAVGGTGRLRRVRVRVANLGEQGASWAELDVWACPRTAGRCSDIDSQTFTLAAGESLEKSFRWDGFGTLGDVTVYARVCGPYDTNPSNDRTEADHYVVAGGTGVGVAPPRMRVAFSQPGETWPSPCETEDPSEAANRFRLRSV